MKKFCVFLLMFWAFSALGAGYSGIDSYVQHAPEIKDHGQLEKVVHYITQKYQKDEEKAYAILAWIVFNVDYDDYFYRQSDKNNKTRRDLSYKIPEQGDIIKTRLGVCKDIAALYSEMLKMADLKSHVVTGCHAPENDKRACQENPHAWNVVWIKDQWELVDPTFAMGQASAMQDVSSKRGYERAVKKRERRSSDAHKARTERHINSSWFMVDPKKMKEDHQPSEEKWSLIKRMDRKRKD